MQETKRRIAQLKKIYAVKSLYGSCFGNTSPVKNRLQRWLLMITLILICILLAYGDVLFPYNKEFYIYLISLAIFSVYWLIKRLKEANELNKNGYSNLDERIEYEVSRYIEKLSVQSLKILKEYYRMEYLRTDTIKSYFPWVNFFTILGALITISIKILPIIDIPHIHLFLIIAMVLFSFWYLFRLIADEIKSYQAARDRDLYLLLFSLERDNIDSYIKKKLVTRNNYRSFQPNSSAIRLHKK